MATTEIANDMHIFQIPIPRSLYIPLKMRSLECSTGVVKMIQPQIDQFVASLVDLVSTFEKPQVEQTLNEPITN